MHFGGGKQTFNSLCRLRKKCTHNSNTVDETVLSIKVLSIKEGESAFPRIVAILMCIKTSSIDTHIIGKKTK